MDKPRKFYIVENIACSDPNKNLKSKFRIVSVPDDFPFKFTNSLAHNSIRHLKRYDPIWKEVNAQSSKTANKMCEQRFIMESHDFILTPYDEEFNKYAFALLEHSIHGSYGKDFQGLHLLSPFNKDIVEINQTKPEDRNGVWEGRVTIYNKLRDEYYDKISTFFPKSWTPSHFMFEAYSAIKRVSIVSEISGYNSITDSGVPVKIIIKDRKAKTIYPIYEDSKVSD